MDRLFAALLAVGLICGLFGLSQLGAFDSFDRAAREMRFSLLDRSPSGDIVFVDIDSSSLAAVGIWPWPRGLYAEALDRLMELGADAVAFDIDFSSLSSSEEDEKFRAALERAGGYAILGAFFQQAHGSVEPVPTLPQPVFAAIADPVLVNVMLDRLGAAWAVPRGGMAGGRSIASLALTFGQPTRPWAEPIVIDYSIDLNAVPRIAFADLLAGNIEAKSIAGKRIVIGASAIELRDIFRVDRFGVVAGPLVQIAAAETVRSNRHLVALDLGWPLAGVALFALAGIVALRGLSPLQLALSVIAIMFGAEIAAFIAFVLPGWMLPTAVFHAGAIVLVSVRMAEIAVRTIAQKSRLQQRLAYLARHDANTNCLSRPGLIETLARSYDKGGLTVAVVRLERIDLIRNALGHAVGDAVLALVAERLRTLEQTWLAYLDRDSFALVCAGRSAESVLEELRADVGMLLEAPFAPEAHEVIVGWSIAVAHSDDAPTPARLIGNAELALLSARPGSTEINFFTPALANQIASRQRLDVDLRHALDTGGLSLAFQPQLSLVTGDIVGYEALARWHHPTLGPISPTTFIPLAEETGLIARLGAWVLEAACRHAHECGWDGRLAVNASPAQLALSDIVAIASRALVTTGFAPHRLDIEITESSLVENAVATRRAFDQLRDCGIGIAIDDFGTGYSSLGYLAELPFDKLKFDKAFADRLQSRATRSIIAAVTTVMHEMGKIVVIEGIETVEQFRTARALGCDVGQGYLFGRPGPAIFTLPRRPILASSG